MKRVIPLIILSSLLIGVAQFSHAEEDERLKPYVLATTTTGDLETVSADVKAKLIEGGFQFLGCYQPYDNAWVCAVTDESILNVCSKSENGAFAAALRVAVTDVDGELQIAYNCPRYLANVYRLEEDLSHIKRKFALAIGYEKAFGSEDGIEVKKLRDYNYVPGGFIPMPMPEFDDVDELAEYDSYESAVAAVDAGIEANPATELVYRIEVPGLDAMLYGVGILDGDGADGKVMETCDREELKATAHLPYEMLVTGNQVIALRGKFRIAQSFPDLSMGTFMKIRKAPGDIEETLESIANGG